MSGPPVPVFLLKKIGMVLMSKLNLALAKVEDPSQRQESLSRDVPWRGHASRLPLDLDVQQLSVMLLTDPPTPVVVLFEKQLLEAERLHILP